MGGKRLHAKSGKLPTQERGRADDVEQLERLLNIVVQVRDLMVHEGFTDLTFVNPKTGETRLVEVKAETRPIVEVTARAMEVFGTREKALRWLNTPVRSLGDQTPLSLLNTPEGVAQVQDTLGRVEHGVW
jgi:putative toxin-antitoxin system antitoxin component (TIGR02293 family)